MTDKEKIRQEIERRITDNTFGAKLELIDILAWLDTLSEESSESLEEAAEEYASINCDDYVDYDSNICFIEEGMRVAFKAGAKWQVEQFEKNRIAACDKQTKEEYDREVDFATGIIEKEHRNPTFSDAINYGMDRQKEQMLKEAVEGEVVKDINNKLVVTAKNVNLDKFKFGDKVRIIIVEEARI